MQNNNLRTYIKDVLKNMPADWLRLTTHRLDIYDEAKAKSQFLEQFEDLYKSNTSGSQALSDLPTAYDYIRLGHPLSSVLEWMIAKEASLHSEQVISFGSQTMPIQAVLRTNLLANKKTRIAYQGTLPKTFNASLLKEVYRYDFDLLAIQNIDTIPSYDGSTIFISLQDGVRPLSRKHKNIDFQLQLFNHLGSILLINTPDHLEFVNAIQHVRRRETIAMTPADALTALQSLVQDTNITEQTIDGAAHKTSVESIIKKITNTKAKALVASSGLSMQYAIMMGLVHDAQENHPGKAIKFIVPPNCYGGTNDQARRVAACNDNVQVVDLPVDGDNDMVQSVDRVLTTIAQEDAVPYIIAEIPTNPRVEVPNLDNLRAALSKPRTTASGENAIDPVFILDQTFCPNVHFLGEKDILSSVRTISYASGSKFPSGGKCTAGYCVANDKAATLMDKIEMHLTLCDNEATSLQYEILAQQLPSMIKRIANAYVNTRDFVTFIEEALPAAKINFVSEALALQGFTPSVFSLDLPTKGTTSEEREIYKRNLNLKLIHMMITEIPNESKYCVSYGQLKGCYWTIPATSTQGTTKESDKDYIARISLSPDMDLERHKKVFADFVDEL